MCRARKHLARVFVASWLCLAMRSLRAWAAIEVAGMEAGACHTHTLVATILPQRSLHRYKLAVPVPDPGRRAGRGRHIVSAHQTLTERAVKEMTIVDDIGTRPRPPLAQRAQQAFCRRKGKFRETLKRLMKSL